MPGLLAYLRLEQLVAELPLRVEAVAVPGACSFVCFVLATDIAEVSQHTWIPKALTNHSRPMIWLIHAPVRPARPARCSALACETGVTRRESIPMAGLYTLSLEKPQSITYFTPSTCGRVGLGWAMRWGRVRWCMCVYGLHRPTDTRHALTNSNASNAP